MATKIITGTDGELTVYVEDNTATPSLRLVLEDDDGAASVLFSTEGYVELFQFLDALPRPHIVVHNGERLDTPQKQIQAILTTEGANREMLIDAIRKTNERGKPPVPTP